MSTATQGISIVCVFNDAAVREHCLDRSIAAGPGGLPVEYLPVDNTEHRFATAGAALNHGARRARHDVVVFVHQDVYLHSLDRLLAVAEMLRSDATWGQLGASGVTSGGALVGRLRDRVQVLGRSAPRPVPVDSVDEVLFVLRRDDVLVEPLSEDSDLAWHAYAVEYGLRVRRRGLAVGAVDTGITHNSLTVNLARLDVAHARVAATYPEAVPVRTTCGTVGGAVREHRLRSLPVVGTQGWRAQWLRESVLAVRARRRLGVPAVIGDIRRDVDLLPIGPGSALHLVDIDATGGFAEYGGPPLDLVRRDQSVRASAVADSVGAVAAMAQVPAGDSVLVSGLGIGLLEPLARHLRATPTPCVVGVHDHTMWLLAGPVATRLPERWESRRATPLGGRGRVRPVVA
jgi:Glycosyltransferase like family